MQSTTADAQALLAYAGNVLDQALALAAAHELPGAPAFADQVGPHLRHVIEHFEALLRATDSGQVDYDRREREVALERSPALARRRLRSIQQQVAFWPAQQFGASLSLAGTIGIDGDSRFAASSSFARELVFVASHAVHHFALLRAHCHQHGIFIGADFGKAPATVAHERARAISTTHDTHEVTPCPMPTPAT